MPAILKLSRRIFHSYLNETKKKTTILSIRAYNLISNHFHANFNGIKRNRAKFKVIRNRKNKLTDRHGGMIIQLRSAIFERIPKCPNTGISNCFNSSSIIAVFMCFSSLIQKLSASRCL